MGSAGFYPEAGHLSCKMRQTVLPPYAHVVKYYRIIYGSKSFEWEDVLLVVDDVGQCLIVVIGFNLARKRRSWSSPIRCLPSDNQIN